MGIGETLTVIAFAIGFIKYQLDVADKEDKRMDGIEKEVALLSKKMDIYSQNTFNSLEFQEARINNILSQQSYFMDKIKTDVERIIKNDK